MAGTFAYTNSRIFLRMTSNTGQLIRRGATALAIFGIGYYLASPFLAVNGLKDAFVARDADRVNKFIDYPALQSDLKSQLGPLMLQSVRNDPEMAGNPFAGFAAVMITPMVNSMVDSYITPSGMKMLLQSDTNEQPSVTQDQQTENLVAKSREFRKALEKTSMGYEGLDKFVLSATGEDGKEIRLLFNRQGFADWKLKSVVLPQF